MLECGPRSGSKVWEAVDREIGKPGENRSQIVAHLEFQTAPLPDREATLANLEKLEAGNYLSRWAATGHAYTYRVLLIRVGIKEAL
jgi:hypothetical protein